MQQGLAATSDENLKAVINLRLARVQLQLKQADAALKTLDAVKGEGWTAIVADLRGEALLSKGDKKGARSAWEAGVNSDASPALSEMMQMKINNCPSERDPMQLRKLLLPGLLSVTLLSGCSLLAAKKMSSRCLHYRRLKTSLPRPLSGAPLSVTELANFILTFIR